MPKIKLTKTELKTQKDALQRYIRFLPLLQLKKQQLQSEIAGMRSKVDDVGRERSALLDAVSSWVALLADEAQEIPVVLERIASSSGNIAGVAIPVFERVVTRRPETDLFATPAWVDDAAEAAAALMSLSAREDILKEQIRLVEEELRTTSQRVNLFEKVKIPECRDNIRAIGVALGDEQASSVVRGKIAKGRTVKEAAAEAV
jgi:H(+)-transporting ATP synthase, vacuolar type, subunit D